MTKRIVVFGATGYTGSNTVKILVEKGIRPLLVGRSRNKLKELAGQHGGLDIAIANVDDPSSLVNVIEKGDVLISTVGPFTIYGDTAVNAAIQKGAHYIDSTGEPGFICKIFETYGPMAAKAGVALITACGYDYVPGNCAAGLALTQAGPDAVRVDTGYYIIGRNALHMSQGTAASTRYSVLDPGKTWRDGRLVECYNASGVRTFNIDGKKRAGILLPTSECYSLPKVYTQLRDVNVYLGWYGNMSYALHKVSGINAMMLHIPGYKLLMKKMISLVSAGKGSGPDEALRKKTGSQIVSEAFDSNGNRLSRVDLKGANGYDFTFKILAWTAEKIATDDWNNVSGAIGPIEAFGLKKLAEGVKEAGLTPVKG